MIKDRRPEEGLTQVSKRASYRAKKTSFYWWNVRLLRMRMDAYIGKSLSVKGGITQNAYLNNLQSIIHQNVYQMYVSDASIIIILPLVNIKFSAPA